MPVPHVKAARARDRALRTVRTAGWAVGIVSAGLTAGLSVVAAQAFKGHDGKVKPAATPAVPVRRAAPPARVHVPPPQHVPAISGAPAPIAPPAEPPSSSAPPVDQSAQPAPVPAPPPAAVSGGS